MKNRFYLITAMFIGLAASAPKAGAHHSFSSQYDINKPVTLKGTLSKVEWINPHGWLYIDVKDANGKVVTWGVETGGPNALLRRGVRKIDFPIGSEVLVKGFQAKNGTPTANGRTVTLSDGRSFFTGSSGTGAPKDGADPSEK